MQTELLPGTPKHRRPLRQQFVEVRHLHLITTSPGKSQQLPRQFRPAGHLPLNGLQTLAMGMTRRQIQKHQRRIPLDPHQEIVEIMRYSPRQRPYRLHLLRPQQPFLQPPPLLLRLFPDRYIPGAALETHNLSLFIVEPGNGNLDIEKRTVFCILPQFQDTSFGPLGPRFQQFLSKEIEDPGQIFRAHVGFDGHGHGLFDAITRMHGDGGADKGEAAVQGHGPDHVRGILRNESIFLFALPHLPLRLFPGGDVFHDAQGAHNGARGITEGGSVDVDVDQGTVASLPAQLPGIGFPNQHPLEIGPVFLNLVLRDDGIETTEDILLIPSENAFGRGTPGNHLPFPIQGHDRQGRGENNRLQRLTGFPQRLLYLLTFRNIGKKADLTFPAVQNVRGRTDIGIKYSPVLMEAGDVPGPNLFPPGLGIEFGQDMGQGLLGVNIHHRQGRDLSFSESEHPA